MQSPSNAISNTLDRWFFLFILFHLSLWTLVPASVRYHLPMDSLEGALWGQQLEWGYDKNPFVNAWVTAFAMKLSGYQDIAIYFISQVAVVTCFFATWQLAKRMLSAPFAFLSVILLEGIQYYHLHAIDLSDNLLELTLWSLTVYSFYCAVRGSKFAWGVTGFLAAIAMVTKYYSGFLLLSLALFLFTDKEARKQLATIAPYIGLGIFIIVLMPHVIWLFENKFITIEYMLTRTDSLVHWSNRLLFPTLFFVEQFIIALPMFILYALLFLGHSFKNEAFSPSTFNKRFIFCAAFLPFIFTLIVSCLFHLKLHAGWGTPLMTLWPLALFVLFKRPSISMLKIRSITISIILLSGLVAAVYAYTLIRSTTASSANFAGKALAITLTQEWHNRYHQPLRFVAGSRSLVGTLAYYSPDHPSGWIDWSTSLSPWIDEKAVKKHGAIFIFNAVRKIPREIEAKFYPLAAPRDIKLAWLRNIAKLPPQEIKVIFVPPQLPLH